MTALDVECATCLAGPGERCTTRFSRQAVSPHTARLRLARVEADCPRCGAGRRQPCLTPAGKVQTRIHTARGNEAWRVRQRAHDAAAPPQSPEEA